MRKKRRYPPSSPAPFTQKRPFPVVRAETGVTLEASQRKSGVRSVSYTTTLPRYPSLSVRTVISPVSFTSAKYTPPSVALSAAEPSGYSAWMPFCPASQKTASCVPAAHIGSVIAKSALAAHFPLALKSCAPVVVAAASPFPAAE